MSKIPCVKVSRPDFGGGYYILRLDKTIDFSGEFDGAEVGEQVLLEYCEMEEADLDALPEFAGW